MSLGSSVYAGCWRLGLAAGAAAPKSSTPTNNGRVLYKWVDKDGVTHYGDHVPPEYASQEQHILNSQGYEIKHLDAQKTAEQAAADEQKRSSTRSSANCAIRIC